MTHKRPGRRAISQRQERAKGRQKASQDHTEAPVKEASAPVVSEPAPEPEAGLARAEIDLNIRMRGGGTYVGFEDLSRPVKLGEQVVVFESGTELAGDGYVKRIDPIKKIVVLAVDWKSLKTSDRF